MTEFEQIYRAYFQDVELYLRAISHNESLAEELTEQVFFQALNALPKFRGDCDVRTWLCSMARNAYLSHLRKERPSQPIDELEISDPKQAVEEQIIDDQHGKPHAPVLEEQQHQHRQRTDDVGSHLRQQMGKGGFNGVHALDDNVLIGAPCGSSGSFPLVTSEACSDARQTGPV